MIIIQREELASRDLERLVVDMDRSEPGFQSWLESLENCLEGRRVLAQDSFNARKEIRIANIQRPT
jgi:hypothetical protein